MPDTYCQPLPLTFAYRKRRNLWLLQAESWLWLSLQPSYSSTKPYVKVCCFNPRLETVLQSCAPLGIPFKCIFVNPGNINWLLLLTAQYSLWEGTGCHMPGGSNGFYWGLHSTVRVCQIGTDRTHRLSILSTSMMFQGKVWDCELKEAIVMQSTIMN